MIPGCTIGGTKHGSKELPWVQPPLCLCYADKLCHQWSYFVAKSNISSATVRRVWSNYRMARFRSIRYAAAITQHIWRRALVAEIAGDQGLRPSAGAIRPVHLVLALSMSSVPRRGSSADVKGETASEKDALDELMFVDSSQEEVSGRMWRAGENREDSNDGWKSQLAWLSSMVEPAVNMYKDALPPGDMAEKWDGSASGRTVVDIVSSLLKATAGMQEWGIADITLGLYLLSVRHTAERAADLVHGTKMMSDVMVQEWMYHLELAWGAYMKDAAMLSRVTMLQEEHVVKFVSRSSVMRPAYYVGVDHRQELVILAIRGTQSVHDLITDLSTEHPERFDGEPVHYGSVEAARWFLRFEVDTLKKCLEENKGFRLLVTGHSLGGATAALLGMMLRQNSQNLLGLPSDQIKVIGIGTPPCVSRALASKCRDFTATLVLQDDVIPRVSPSALIRLRNEILSTDWNDVLKDKSERKGLVDLVASTIEALTSVQDAARKYGAIARRKMNLNGTEEDRITVTKESSGGDLEKQKQELMQTVKTPMDVPDLVTPGTLFHICSRRIKTPEFNRNADGSRYSLWKGDADFYLERIVVSANMFSDHRCESYYYSLRDVLKNLPTSTRTTLDWMQDGRQVP